EPMTSLNPVFTIGRQLEEVIRFRYHLRGKKALIASSPCWKWWAYPIPVRAWTISLMNSRAA
ncbi:MAG TPA: hypothetical protein PLB62_14925, partial [Candidatus Sumerlaeota bacterium]|nr:hypothetical protein [Candidatus Sumerlaeota bacterium]